MVADKSSPTDPFERADLDVINVSFPYASLPVAKADPEPSVKIDYIPKTIPGPKRTLNIRRAPLKTRLVDLTDAYLSDTAPPLPSVPPKMDSPSPIKDSDLQGTLQKLLKTVGSISLTAQENQRQGLAIATELNRQSGATTKLEAIQKHLDQSHKVETANQRLFDAMHQELKGYKDGFLFDALQKPIIRDLLSIFDDLSGQVSRMSAFIETQKLSKQETPHWLGELQASHDNLSNTVFFIIEVLNRLDVTIMENTNQVLDLKIHKVVGFDTTQESDEKNQIAKVVRPGFFWKDRILRPCEILLKKAKGTSPTKTITPSI